MNDSFEIRVCCDETLLRARHTSGRALTAQIAARIHGFWCPHPKWDDFAGVILGWWIEHIRDLWSGRVNTADLLFMDGPYGILLSQANDADVWKADTFK